MMCGLLWDQRDVWVVPIVLPSARAMPDISGLAVHGNRYVEAKKASLKGTVLYYRDAEATTHFWLGRLTGLGAVTLPKDTIRPLGLQVPAVR